MMNEGKRPVKRPREVDSPQETYDTEGVDLQFHIQGGKRNKTHDVAKQKEIWLSSESDDDANTQYTTRAERFANIRVKKSDCYYRSNLQTTVKEIRSLNLTEAHLCAMKLTPFWFLFNAIRSSDEETLLDMTKKHESDMRLLIQRFDVQHMGIKLGETVVQITKRDVVLIFGVIDGNGSIRLSLSYEITPWMSRCFPEIMKYKGTKNMTSMKKFCIFTELKRMVRMDDKLYAQDVARLIHCYLLASLFMPNGNTSIPWCLCEYLEDFSSIGLYDWSSLIVSQLNRQIQTRTMKVAGCAMLLPYWLCEHTWIIGPSRATAFPRFMRWNLNKLHQKLYRKDLDAAIARNEILIHLRPSVSEKAAFKDLNAFQIKSQVNNDVDTPRRPTHDYNTEPDDENQMEEMGTDNSETESIEHGENGSSFVSNLDDNCVDGKKATAGESNTNMEMNDEFEFACSREPASIQSDGSRGSRNVQVNEHFNSSTDAFIGETVTHKNVTVQERYRPSIDTDVLIGEMMPDQVNQSQPLEGFLGDMISEPYVPRNISEDVQLQMEKNISLLNDEIRKIREENKKMHGDKIISDVQIVKLRRIGEEKDKEILQLKSQISALKDELAKSENCSESSAERKSEGIRLDEMKTALEGEIEMLKSQNKEMLDEREKVNSVINDLKDLKCQLNNCSAEYESKKRESDGKCVQLESSLEELLKEYILLKDMKDDEVLKKDSKIKEQMETIDGLNKMNTEMDERIQVLIAERKEIADSEKIEKLHEDIKRRESELIEAKKWLSQTKTENDTLKDENEKLKSKYLEMEGKNNAFVQELETTIQQKSDAMQIMLSQNNALNGKVKRLIVEMAEDLERRINEMTNPAYTQERDEFRASK